MCDHTRLSNPGISRAEFDIDLAKDVAAWQVENGQVPPDLTDLLQAFRQRIARFP
jgi:hypothetical protein